MKIIRNKNIEIIPKGNYETKVILDLLKNECIKSNPKYEKMISSGRFQNGIDKEIITFSYNKKENNFKIYKGNYDVYKRLLDLKLPLEEEKDERVSFPVDIVCNIGPRDDEQKKVIASVKSFYEGFGYGIIEASPSAGKTAMACMMMGHVKQRTLVLVDMNLLVEQFVESILQFTNVKKEEIGFIRGSEVDFGLEKKVIIATNQSLAKKPEILAQIEKNIGFVIQDEAQIASCDTVQKVFGELRPKYQLGLSGTPYRDDRMDFLIREAIGPIMCKANRQSMVENGSMITPVLRPLFIYDREKINSDDYSNSDFREVVDDFYNCPKAIDKITNLVMAHYRQDDSQLLICKEKTMINAYYKALVIKLCGVNFLNNALKEKEKKEKEMKKQYDLMFETNYTMWLTETENKAVSSGKHLTDYYKIKCLSRKEKELNKLFKQLEKLKEQDIMETEFVKENELVKTICVLTGEVNGKERDQIIEETNDGKIKVLLVTTVVDKGVSINRLNILYLLFSSRERNVTTQRVGRISRAYPGKKPAIVYDIIYPHFFSTSQFSNKKGDCRMTAHRGFTKIHPSIDLFIWWINSIIKKQPMPKKQNDDFMNNWYKKYVIEI